jgi:hypothetical protein
MKKKKEEKKESKLGRITPKEALAHKTRAPQLEP